jgi:hypothetical protein
MGSKGVAFIARAGEIAAEIVYKIAFSEHLLLAFEGDFRPSRSRLGDRMVNNRFNFSLSLFPPPWSNEDNGKCFIDNAGGKLAYVYF